MRYVVDLRHPLQAPCGNNAPVEGAREDIYLQSSRPWECGNPEGISKECGKGGKPASWLSMLSILCHFHGLLSLRNQSLTSIGDASSIQDAYPLVSGLLTTHASTGKWTTCRDCGQVINSDLP